MKFSNLQYIVQSVRRRLRCPDCKRAYKLDEVTVVDLYEAECMLDLYCTHCTCGFSFSFEIREVDGTVTVIEKPVPPEQQLTEDEVAGISNTLKQYEGNMDELLRR